MGAWGFQPFENDGAMEVIGLIEDGDADFDAIFDEVKEDAELREASAAIAAAELVASAKAGTMPDIPEELEEWFKLSKPQLRALAPRALIAVQLIRAKSELKDLWAESEDAAKWEATIESIEARLK